MYQAEKSCQWQMKQQAPSQMTHCLFVSPPSGQLSALIQNSLTQTNSPLSVVAKLRHSWQFNSGGFSTNRWNRVVMYSLMLRKPEVLFCYSSRSASKHF